MDRVLGILGNVVAAAGILTCFLAVMLRLSGSQWIVGYEPMTIFIGGIALMIMGCLAMLQAIALQLKR
jgi:hypothetical protein